MSTAEEELKFLLEGSLEDLATCLDTVFENINWLTIWRSQNGFTGSDENIREMVSGFFSKDFGDDTGTTIVRLLLGP